MARRVPGRVAGVVLLVTVLVAGVIGLGVRAFLQDTTPPAATPQALTASSTVDRPTPTPLGPFLLGTASPVSGSTATATAPGIPATATNPPAAPTATVADFDPERLYAAVRPAVVTISNKQKTRPGATTLREANAGSGTIFDRRGYIVTNRHVIDGADAIDVSLEGGATIPSTLVGFDKVIDIAVVKIDAAAVPAVAPLGDSALVRAGQHVIAIGNPHQFDISVTRGIISGVDRSIGGVDGMVQTDAPISPGSSGGPLVNTRGEVIGIISSSVRTNQAERIAFAIPINTVQRLTGIIIATGNVVRPYIGVTTELLTPASAADLGAKVPRGAYISEVSPDTPAARAGLRKGDVILTIGPAPVDRAHPLPLVLLDFKPGDTAMITIDRDGAEQHIAVTFSERPADLDP